MTDDSLRINKSRPPLRWFANMCGSIAGWAIMRAAYLDEMEDFKWRYNVYSFIWKYTWAVYYKFGTFYEMNFDMSGDGWNDYDSDGIPYWEKWIDWDFEDEWTGDAFRIISK